jgi:pimeloyl-ACP methyl ester carboxylesterase
VKEIPMSAISKYDLVALPRAQFLGASATAFAATQYGTLGPASAQTTFSSLKQIDAGLLSVGYADVGPRNGPPVILLHGWPALHINRAVIGGFDWGARTADIIAALWPERCKAMVSVSGYLISSIDHNRQPLPPLAEWGFQQTHLEDCVAEMEFR